MCLGSRRPHYEPPLEKYKEEEEVPPHPPPALHLSFFVSSVLGLKAAVLFSSTVFGSMLCWFVFSLVRVFSEASPADRRLFVIVSCLPIEINPVDMFCLAFCNKGLKEVSSVCLHSVTQTL